MTIRQCNNCYFCDICGYMEPCEDYYPIEKEAEDEYIETLVKDGRKEYQEEWNKYISDFI